MSEWQEITAWVMVNLGLGTLWVVLGFTIGVTFRRPIILVESREEMIRGVEESDE